MVAATYMLMPDLWIEDTTEETPWELQRTILQALAVERRVAVASANATGKSWLAARAVCWFMNMFDPAVVVTTAPTARQVRHILWKEIHAAHDRAKYRGHDLGGELLTLIWKFTEEKFAIGFATRDYDPDTFQGLHSTNLLVVVDEAAGITEAVWEGIKSILRGANTHLVAIGNPTCLSGTFYEAFQPENAGRWWTANISAFDTPNIKQGRVKIPGLVTLEDIEDARQDWGEGSFLWEARILGRFPRVTTDTLIPLADVEVAAQQEFQPAGDVEVGADIGWFGDDETVFIARAGPCAFDYASYGQQGTMDTTGLLVQFLRKHHARRVKVDVVGYGAGVYDRLRELQDQGDLPGWLEIIPMNAGAKAEDSLRYANAGSEWWGRLAKRLADRQIGGPAFAVKRTQAQLASRKRGYTSSGQMRLEPKEKMRARGGKSPDWGDAIAMAFAEVQVQVDDRAAEALRKLSIY